MTSSAYPVTSLFRSEYERELETWLRRRFTYLCIAYLVITGLMLVRAAGLLVISRNTADGDWWSSLPLGIDAALSVGVVIYVLFHRRHQLETRDDLLHAASIMLFALGALSILVDQVGQWVPRFDHDTSPLMWLFGLHFTACLFLPWSPKDSLRPTVPLLVVWAILFIINSAVADGSAGAVAALFGILFAPLILLPGLAVCTVRLRMHGRTFRVRMYGKHFLAMRQEMRQARMIHDAMFPQPYHDDQVRFDYTYLPMREVGGDFIHFAPINNDAHPDPDRDDAVPPDRYALVLIDVTGHGLAAALTVNRLHGEMERLYAETPDIAPEDVLRLLNRYICLTLRRHGIFATAFCAVLDARTGRLDWANAGHPPAFVRTAADSVQELGSTACVLGALDDDEFDIEARDLVLEPGDTMVIYTDGVYEARDRNGRQLGLEHLRDVMHFSTSPRNWPQFIASTVKKHTASQGDDDILIASLTFTGRTADRDDRSANANAASRRVAAP